MVSSAKDSVLVSWNKKRPGETNVACQPHLVACNNILRRATPDDKRRTAPAARLPIDVIMSPVPPFDPDEDARGSTAATTSSQSSSSRSLFWGLCSC